MAWGNKTNYNNQNSGYNRQGYSRSQKSNAGYSKTAAKPKPVIKYLRTLLIMTDYNEYGWRTEFNLVEIDGTKTYDIRDWKNDHISHGNQKHFSFDGPTMTRVYSALNLYIQDKDSFQTMTMNDKPKLEVVQKEEKKPVKQTLHGLNHCEVCDCIIFDFEIHAWGLNFCSNKCANDMAKQIEDKSEKEKPVVEKDVAKPSTGVHTGPQYDFPNPTADNSNPTPQEPYGLDNDGEEDFVFNENFFRI